jgi:predicted RNase H-like nuclease (RuvC/YqgF family)
MNLPDATQSSLAVVVAATITGLWGYLAQKAKSREAVEDKKEDKVEKGQISLVQGYQGFNEQLQDRIISLNAEIENLWLSLKRVQESLVECERGRLDDQRSRMSDLRRIIELERMVGKSSPYGGV